MTHCPHNYTDNLVFVKTRAREKLLKNQHVHFVKEKLFFQNLKKANVQNLQNVLNVVNIFLLQENFILLQQDLVLIFIMIQTISVLDIIEEECHLLNAKTVILYILL